MALLCFTAGEDTAEEVKKGDLGSFPRITLFRTPPPCKKTQNQSKPNNTTELKTKQKAKHTTCTKNK